MTGRLFFPNYLNDILDKLHVNIEKNNEVIQVKQRACQILEHTVATNYWALCDTFKEYTELRPNDPNKEEKKKEVNDLLKSFHQGKKTWKQLLNEYDKLVQIKNRMKAELSFYVEMKINSCL